MSAINHSIFNFRLWLIGRGGGGGRMVGCRNLVVLFLFIASLHYARKSKTFPEARKEIHLRYTIA